MIQEYDPTNELTHGLPIIEVPVDKIAPKSTDESEPDPARVIRIIDDMRERGQRYAILVRKTDEGWETVEGKHRLEAARRLGMRAIHAHDVSHISNEELQRYGEEQTENLRRLRDGA